MLTVHPTLLIGPSDWQPERMPQDEFVQRMNALWQSFPSATRAIVYGNPAHHAELAYLTNLVTKLEAGVALLTRGGESKLFLGGGPNMLGAARPLTFLSDLVPLRGAQAIGQAAVAGSRADEVLLIGAGAMPTAFRDGLIEGMGGSVLDATPQLWTQMQRKSAHELSAIRGACAVLRAAIAAIEAARRAGAGLTAAILEGERAANASGAQDVRMLFSRNGGRALQPFDTLVDQRVDPLQVYVAVRHFNYWAEGFASLSDAPNPAKDKAAGVLRLSLGAIKGGARKPDVASLIAGAIRPDRPHPVTETAFANVIGLALDAAPYTDVGATFEAGETYSLKIGVSAGTGHHAIVSAMIAVREDGNDVLWIGT